MLHPVVSRYYPINALMNVLWDEMKKVCAGDSLYGFNECNEIGSVGIPLTIPLFRFLIPKREKSFCIIHKESAVYRVPYNGYHLSVK